MTDVQWVDQEKIMANVLLDGEPRKKDGKVEMISRVQMASV